MSRSKATAVPLMAIGWTGARDMDDTRVCVFDEQNCCNGKAGAVAIVGCSSNRMIGSRSTTSVAIEVMRALPICKRCMDTATTRKRGSTRTISRSVCVISIRILRSGWRRKSHAPFWSSGRRSDPPIDCNRLNLSLRQHVAAVGRRVTTLCKGEDGMRQQLALYHVYDNFCLPHASIRVPLPQPLPTNGTGSATQGRPCTPAMAAEWTDHVWTLREVLLFRVPPWPQPAGV